MPNYQITFVGDGEPSRPPMSIICVGDRQALDWAAGFLEHQLGAEVSSNGRQVGWVTAADNHTDSSVSSAER